ncbi:MAG: glycosyltransferase family 39 protein [Thermoanaerobaculia bacterium]
MSSLLACLAILASGWSLGLLLGMPHGATFGFRFGASWVLGLAVRGSLGFLLVLAGVIPAWWTDFAIAAALAGCAAVRARVRTEARARSHPAVETVPWSRPARLLGAATLLALAFSAVTSWLEPVVEWDTLAIWGLKAKALATAPLGDTSLLRDPALAYAHLDYPLLWPLALAADPAFADRTALSPGKSFGPMTLAAIVALVFTSIPLLSTGGRRVARMAALSSALLVATLPVAQQESSRLLADLPLALFFLFAAVTADLALRSRDAAAARLACIGIGALPLVKNEGTAICLALLGATLVAGWRSGRKRLPLLWLASTILVAGPWLAYRATLPRFHHNSELDLTLARLAANLGRLPELLTGGLRSLVEFPDWGLFWLLIALGIGARIATRARPRERSLLGWLLLAPVPFYLAALVANGWDPAPLLEFSFNRLALGFAPLAAVWSALELARHAPRAAEG